MRAFRIAYDGRPYHGFQRQPDVRTVEGRLLEALDSLGLDCGATAQTAEAAETTWETPPTYSAAGRTDAGVSALAQTVAFDCPAWLTPSALDARLPDTIRAWASADVPDGFHATHDAIDRTYTYYLCAPEQRISTADFDDRAETALDAMSGHHDVQNLCYRESDTRRTLDCRGHRDGAAFVITVEASGFLRQLVRRVVTLIEQVAAGERTLGFLERALDPEPLEGPDGIPPAPATGLLLSAVAYDCSFSVAPEQAGRASEWFAQRQAEWATRARVADAIGDALAGRESQQS